MTALVVDDEPNAVGVMVELLIRSEMHFETVHFAGGVEEAKSRLKELHYDLLFLDIQMRDGTGFDLLESFDKPRWNQLVFTTAYDEFAVKAFKFSAVDYLLKPFGLSDLNETLKRCEKEQSPVRAEAQLKEHYKEKNFDQITLHTSGGFESFKLNEILFVKSDVNYSFFYLENGARIVVAKTLKHYDDLLKDHGFLRTHRSYLVNVRKIKTVHSQAVGSLKLESGDEIPVSRRKYREVMDLLAELR